MRSMTGFGAGTALLGEARLSLEIRSLNHRFVEMRVRLPSEIADQAFYVEQCCRERLKRGRYDISARLETPSPVRARFDVARGKAVYAALTELRDAVAPGADVPLSLLTSFPEVLVQNAYLDQDVVRAALLEALSSAVHALNDMRSFEGATLRQDLHSRLASAQALRQRIEASHPELAAAFRKRVDERLQRLLDERSLQVEPARLESELALLAERADIAEELARLRSHFDQFGDLCERDEPVGRRLDFLLQEIGREANTIGAKCQDATLAHLVVELKAEIERMREQVQNVE